MNELVVFDEVAATLAEYKAENEKLIFAYETPEGEKQARSHIAKLRKVKTKISDVHKEAKAEALALSKALDSKKRELIGEVDGMIAVHKEPLDAIEAEKVAKAMEEVRKREEAEAKRIAELEAREAAVREKEEKAAAEKAAAEEKIAKAKAEAEQKIAMEKAEKERAEREKHIAEQAAAEARKQAEEAAKNAILEAEKKAREAEEKARAELIAKQLAEKRRIEAEEAAEQKRIANKKHRQKIEDEIIEGLNKINLNPESILLALQEKRIPHVTINY